MIVCIYLHISVIVAIIQREHTFKHLSDNYTKTNCVVLHIGRVYPDQYQFELSEWLIGLTCFFLLYMT